MIQKMKKLTFLVYHKEYDQFLTELQKLGVVHIQPSDDQTEALPSEVSDLQSQLQHVAEVKQSFTELLMREPDAIQLGKALGAEQYVKKEDELKDAIANVEKEVARYTKDVEALQPWGHYDKSQLDRLSNNGVQMYHHIVSAGAFKKFYADFEPNVVSRDKKSVYFVSFAQEGEDGVVQADIPAVTLPEESLAEAQQLLANHTAELERLKAERLVNAEHLGDILALENTLQNKLEYATAQYANTSAADGKVQVVEGWFPVEKESEVSAFLKKANTYYDIRMPEATDNVPIQFKNNSYAQMFERLTKMYGFPSYDEFDPTPILAPFFTLFFAICMGDAGYGLLITLYGLLDMAGKTKKVPILGEMLSGCGSMITALGVATIVVGFFFGTFFGVNIVEAGWIPETTAIGKVIAWLQGDVPGTSYSVQMVGAMCIGVFHICLALVVKAVLFTKKEGFKSQIATWGWVLLIIGGVISGVLALAGALSEQQFTVAIIATGAVAAIAIYILNNVGRLKNSPIKGIIINPLAGIYDTYNMASGLMGDILSYIRIYALCLAGGMLGSAFNMIGDMVWNPTYGWFFAIIIYVIGHLFNLLMSAISAFVHPLRLNFVEYFKNAGYEGKGVGYKPFEIKNK